MERWKYIPGTSGFYQVSDNGRLRSVDRTVTFKDGRVRKYKGQMLRVYIQKSRGYPQYIFTVNCELFQGDVHKLVAKAFVPNYKSLKYVNHKDGKKSNNHYSNLEWVTAKENTDHAIRTGLFDGKPPLKQGEENGNSKLTLEAVVEIRKNYKPRVRTVQSFADKYGVSKPTIEKVLSRKIWAHVD